MNGPTNRETQPLLPITRRVFVYRIVPAAIVLGAAAATPFIVPRLLLNDAFAPMALLQLLGPDALDKDVAARFCMQTSQCNDRTFIENRLRHLLAGIARSAPKTGEEAASTLKALMLEDYKNGRLIDVAGWAMPESLVMLNAYARLLQR